MATHRIGARIVFLFLIGVAGVPLAQAQSPWIASKSEAAQLPRFCWGQMMGDEFRGPEFEILDCGSAMNHYCPSLLLIIRANKMFGNLSWRKDNLLHAKEGVEQTLRDMKPNCSIHDHAEKTLVQINGQLRALK